MSYSMIFMLRRVIYIRHAVMPRHTKLRGYHSTKGREHTISVTSKSCHTWHAFDGFHVTTCDLFHHKVMPRHIGFGIYHSSETAASAPYTWHVNYVAHDTNSWFLCHGPSFMFIIQSCREVPILVYTKRAKWPRLHQAVSCKSCRTWHEFHD